MESRTDNRLTFHWPLVFSLGFFAFVAQTLLFRAFLTVYEGNELGVSCFFSSWLLWVGAGALLARLLRRGSRVLLHRFELLPLAYLPAYVLQLLLIQHSRSLAGIESYELFPFARMLPMSFLANAPVPFCTGFLFALACQWLSPRKPLAVAWVYIGEAVGSCAGGVTATALLWLGVSPEATVFGAAAVLAGAVLLHCWGRRAYAMAVLPLVLLALVLVPGLSGRWARATNLQAWESLLPADAYVGSFSTPQAYYHFGRYQGQLSVIAWESVVESVPASEHAAEVLAVHLAQVPDARRFLIIGAGSYSICQRLAALPQAERITWLAPDPVYPPNLLRVLPAAFAEGVSRLEVPGVDPRTYLRTQDRQYDLVILNLPDATTLALNRYYTQEFLRLVKRRLSPGGVVGVRVSAGENYMGVELMNLGASVYHTLKTVFADVALKPGEETWMMASDGGRLSSFSLELRTRFLQVAGAEELYPSAGLISLYNPERIDYQLSRYHRAEAAEQSTLLLNTDRDPRALLHALLFVMRQTTSPETAVEYAKVGMVAGFALLAAAALLYLLLRVVYVGGAVGRASPLAPDGVRDANAVESHVLVFSSGAAGMGTSLLLMFVYQSRFGSIFLYVGLISAVFMLGLTVGGVLTEQLLVSRRANPNAILAAGLGANLAMLAGLRLLAAAEAPAAFFVSFLVCGLVSGVYVPVAAARLKASGTSDAEAGSLVELGDHAGGALGGLLTGLFLLPVLGLPRAIAGQALILGVNLAALLPYQWLARRLGVTSSPADSARSDRFDRVARAAGYVLFGVAAFILIAVCLHGRATKVDPRQELALAARAMVTGGTLVETSSELESGKRLHYFRHESTPGTTQHYVFSSAPLAADVRGYGGPITLAVAADKDGVLRDVRVLHSNETPAYLRLLGSWTRGLLGRNIFIDAPFTGVDAVTGATVTSTALLRTLEKAGQGFATQVLGQPGRGAAHGPRIALPGGTVLVLVFFAAAALVLRLTRLHRYRRWFLLAVLLVVGAALNAQYACGHVAAVALLRFGEPDWGVGFVMTVGIPVLVALVGNVYCGYLCPFGALQELVGCLRPRRWTVVPSKRVWRYARTVKYLLLFAAICLVALWPGRDVPALDPLTTVFSRNHGARVALVALGAVALAAVYPRFWCRCFCAPGAFLSLLGGMHLLRRLMPQVHPGACGYGVRNRQELDCIRCDRCRHLEPQEARERRDREAAPGRRRADVVYLTAVLLFAVATASLMAPLWHAGLERTQGSSSLSAGPARMRSVDMPKLRRLIDAGQLSDREAMHYRQVDPTTTTPLDPPPEIPAAPSRNGP